MDRRIKELEIKMNHVVDQAGEARPSKTALDTMTNLKVLEARLGQLEKRLGMTTE